MISHFEVELESHENISHVLIHDGNLQMKCKDITMLFLWMMIELWFSTLESKFSMSWGSCTLIQVDGNSEAIDFGML